MNQAPLRKLNLRTLPWVLCLILPFKWRYGLMRRYQIKPPLFYLRKKVVRHYESNMWRQLNLKHPQRFNEKIQIYKLHYRNPLMPILADKYAVRKYLREKGHEDMLVGQYASADSADEIDWGALPESFVVKITHDSGSVVVVKSKTKCDLSALKTKVNRRLQRPYGVSKGEWHYLYIKPRIVVEQYLEDNSGGLRDYKVHCFGGKAMYIQVDNDRFGRHTRAFYDTQWNNLQFTSLYPLSEKETSQPGPLARMLAVSEQLSAPFPYVRIDFYCVGDKLYFGEFTFFHESGIGPFRPDEWDFKWGELLDLLDRRRRISGTISGGENEAGLTDVKEHPKERQKERRLRRDGAHILYDAACTVGSPGFLYSLHERFNRDALHRAGAIEREVRSGRSPATFFRMQDGEFVLKRYRRGGLPGRFVRGTYLWAGESRVRSFREWRLLAELQRLGLPAPRPCAARCRRHGPGGLYYTAELITFRIPGVQPLSQILTSGDEEERLPPWAWRAVGATIRRFHDAGVHHADLNAHNVLLGENDTDVFLVDFDKARITGGANVEKPRNNLKRLRRSLEKLRAQSPGLAYADEDFDELLTGYNA